MVRELERSGVSITTDFRVASATANSIVSSHNRTIDADFVLWTGGVEAPNWPRDSGLTVDERGFIRVGKSLCAVDDPKIFATGDIASLDGQPRPKSGVYAVREGPYLAYNLRASITERKTETISCAIGSAGNSPATAEQSSCLSSMVRLEGSVGLELERLH